MKEVTLTRNAAGLLVPLGPAAAEDVAAFPVGKPINARLTQRRSKPHHDKFMALLRAIYPNQSTWPNFELFRKAIQRACGYFEEHHGQTFDVSIAFDNMDQTEFTELYNKAVELIQTRIIPGIDRADLEREVNDILAGRSAA